jgi:hypothetical protein
MAFAACGEHRNRVLVVRIDILHLPSPTAKSNGAGPLRKMLASTCAIVDFRAVLRHLVVPRSKGTAPVDGSKNGEPPIDDLPLLTMKLSITSPSF